jgi:hypothetical protein
MKRIVKLTESDLTRIVRRVIMEQSSTILTDVKKFCVDNGFNQNQNGDGFSKKTNKYLITITIFQYPDNPKYDKIDLCVSNKGSANCEIVDSSYNNSNWNIENFSSIIKKYL